MAEKKNGGQSPRSPGEAGTKGRAAVLLRHRQEWERHRPLMEEALNGDAEAAKLAKTAAETLKIRQEAERKAWGISDKSETEVSGALVVTWQS